MQTILRLAKHSATRYGLALVGTAAALVLALCAVGVARQKPAPSPTPSEKDEPEAVKVYTEEVILPVVAFDSRGRFDPSLEPADVLVLEDGTPQRVRSVRRVAANVIVVFDMGGQLTDMPTKTPRDTALKIVSSLRPGDSVAVIQNSLRVETLADWTTDAARASRVVTNGFFSSKRSRLSECLLAAAAKAREKPVGNTHVVIFTDGVEAQEDPKRFGEAVKQITATQATTHVVNYSTLARASAKRHNGSLFDLDFEMKRWRRKYAEATRRNDERLASLVREMGGRLLLPANAAEAAGQAEEVSRDIGAQYVVTYAPGRPFSDGGERRRVKVTSRRLGLQLVAMRDYVSPPAKPTPN